MIVELINWIIMIKYILLGILRGVYRIVHKKLERECERKACKYKEFERFSGG